MARTANAWELCPAQTMEWYARAHFTPCRPPLLSFLLALCSADGEAHGHVPTLMRHTHAHTDQPPCFSFFLD